MCIYIDDLNARNLKKKCSTTKLLNQGNRHHKLSNALSKFYRRHHELVSNFNVRLKVKSMQRSWTEAIRHLQHSKPKREINNRTNTKRTYGQPREQLFPKRWPLSIRNRTKKIWTHIRWNVTETPTPKRATENHNKTSTLERSVMNYLGGGGA